MLIIPCFIQKPSPYKAKNSPYECGFDPFIDGRNKFSVKFYLVAILFIIFDLEVMFLFPWAASLKELTTLGFWGGIFFIFLLTVGFIFELSKGALNWKK